MAAYLLIPGAGGAAWYWHRVAPELRRRGHDVVAVDLPAGDDTAGLTDYTDVVVDAAGSREDLVVVAQSMGGLTAPLACARLPVARLVLVNAMIPSPGETGAQWWENTGQDQARRDLDLREGRSPGAAFDPLVHFFHDVPDHVTEQAMAGDPPQSAAPFDEPWPLHDWPDVPTVVISSRADRFFPADFQATVARERLGIEPTIVPGGHLVALSRPRELTAALI